MVSVVSSFIPVLRSLPVQLTLFSYGRSDVVKISATTVRVTKIRPCWRTCAEPPSTKCRFGRAPWPVMAASVLPTSSARFLMVRKGSLCSWRGSFTHITLLFHTFFFHFHWECFMDCFLHNQFLHRFLLWIIACVLVPAYWVSVLVLNLFNIVNSCYVLSFLYL